MATGSATAKLILCGEHAVVYGEPAISVPFTQAVIQTEVIQTEKEIKFSSAFYTGGLKNMPDFLEGIKQMVVSILTKLGDAPVLIRVLSEVPIGRGLGSSAAVSTSIARALYAYFGKTISDDELLELVNRSEKIAHGNPSGVDAVTVVTGKPIWFEKNKTLEPLHFKKKIYLVVADTGIPSETRSAVSDVGRLLKENPNKYRPLITELGNISREIRTQLETNPDLKLIGAEMNKAQNLLEQLTVSDTSLEKLIRVALENGALGAKLTGGGRGGCMVSLVANASQAEKVAEALQITGAAEAWIFTIGEGNHESNSDSSHEYSTH